MKKWLLAIHFVVISKQGISAKGLQWQVVLGSYMTTSAWLQKLRRCMAGPNRSALSGTMEADETYVGGPKPDVRGLGADGKAIAACAVEKSGVKLGRVRLAVTVDYTIEKLHDFVKGKLKLETTVYTDGLSAYLGREKSR